MKFITLVLFGQGRRFIILCPGLTSYCAWSRIHTQLSKSLSRKGFETASSLFFPGFPTLPFLVSLIPHFTFDLISFILNFYQISLKSVCWGLVMCVFMLCDSFPSVKSRMPSWTLKRTRQKVCVDRNGAAHSSTKWREIFLGDSSHCCLLSYRVTGDFPSVFQPLFPHQLRVCVCVWKLI